MPLVTKIFASGDRADDVLPPLVEFPLRPNAKVSELEEAYGIRMEAPADWTLAEAISNRFGPIALHVRGMSAAGEIEQVGMVILPSEEDTSAAPLVEPAPPRSAP
jgi:hypothetical protein